MSKELMKLMRRNPNLFDEYRLLLIRAVKAMRYTDDIKMIAKYAAGESKRTGGC
jgi:hypothetical protein